MAMLVSVEEENGVMESIFTGYKFLSESELREARTEVDGKENERLVDHVRPNRVATHRAGEERPPSGG